MSASPEPRPKRVTPFLCRIFVKAGPHHPIDLFQEQHSLPLSDEYGVYVWKSSTLSTILASLFPALPPQLQNPQNKYSFRSVYFDARALAGDDRERDRERERERPQGRPWKYRELGRIDGRDLLKEGGEIEGAKTLEDLRFQQGDYLSLSIHLPPTHDAPPPGLGAAHATAPANGIRIRSGPPPNGFSIAGAGAPTDSWIDARRDASSRGGGGFGIRGRGAGAGAGAGAVRGGWGGGRDGPMRSSMGDSGWGAPVQKGEEEMDTADGWGAVPREEAAPAAAAAAAAAVKEEVKVEGW